MVSADKYNPNHKVKPKYKLATNQLSDLGIYTFIVSTSTIEACDRRLTLTTGPLDWSEKDAKYDGISHFDIRNIDILNSDEVYSKICDGNNGFRSVAVLRNKCFKRLWPLMQKTRVAPSISAGRQQNILIALGSKSAINKISDNIINNLGLNS